MNKYFTPPLPSHNAPRPYTATTEKLSVPKMTAQQFAEHANITIAEAERVLIEAAAEKERLEKLLSEEQDQEYNDNTH